MVSITDSQEWCYGWKLKITWDKIYYSTGKEFLLKIKTLWIWWFFYIGATWCTTENKCYRIPKGQSKMDNPWKLAIYTNVWYTRQRKTKQNKTKQKHNTICVGNHYTQTNKNNVNKTWALLQTTGGEGIWVKHQQITSCE